jgi:hypothetical protein
LEFGRDWSTHENESHQKMFNTFAWLSCEECQLTSIPWMCLVNSTLMHLEIWKSIHGFVIHFNIQISNLTSWLFWTWFPFFCLLG